MICVNNAWKHVYLIFPDFLESFVEVYAQGVQDRKKREESALARVNRVE